MSRLSFVAVIVLAVLFLSAVSGQTTCGGAGYDLSSLAGQQYSYFDGTYEYAASPSATPHTLESFEYAVAKFISLTCPHC